MGESLHNLVLSCTSLDATAGKKMQGSVSSPGWRGSLCILCAPMTSNRSKRAIRRLQQAMTCRAKEGLLTQPSADAVAEERKR